jgi:hypothetical protein
MSPADSRDSAWGAPASRSTPASQVGRTRRSSRSSSHDLANALAAGPRDEHGTCDPDPSRPGRDGTGACPSGTIPELVASRARVAAAREERVLCECEANRDAAPHGAQFGGCLG